MDFMHAVRQTQVPRAQVAIFWLGQAGFLLKTQEGHTIVIDPYLSDLVERIFPENAPGFKRLSPAPCRADELQADALLISHEHGDHFDVDSIEALMANGRTRVFTSGPVAAQMREKGLDMTRVTALGKGETTQILPTCGLTAMDCDHGELAPEALGFLLDFGFETVYFAGDTALTQDRLAAAIEAKPTVSLLPINGAFGNLDGVLAARYAAMLHSEVLIPCHFWTFPLHHGDPQALIEAMATEAPDVRLHLLCQGEAYVG